MKKRSSSTTLAISIILVALVWFVAISIYSTFLKLFLLCGGSIVSFALAVLISELYLLLIRKDLSEQAAESSALGVIATIGYFLVAILLNTGLVIVGLGGFNWFVLITNLLVNVIYIILLIWIEQHTTRISTQIKRIEGRNSMHIEITRKLGELLGMAEDSDIKERLLRLKESVDYSTSTSSDKSLVYEGQMQDHLDEIVQLIIGRADKKIILSKINTAEITWKQRSSAVR